MEIEKTASNNSNTSSGRQGLAKMLEDNTIGFISVDRDTHNRIVAMTNQHGLEAFVQYVEMAVSEALVKSGQPRLVESAAAIAVRGGAFKQPPFVNATFAPGPCTLWLLMDPDHLALIANVAKKLGKKVPSYILESLQAWARVPHGRAPD